MTEIFGKFDESQEKVLKSETKNEISRRQTGFMSDLSNFPHTSIILSDSP